MITSKAFVLGATERALKTFLQAFIATLGVQIGAVLTPHGAAALPWFTALVTGAVAAILSVATSVLNADFTAGNAAEKPQTVNVNLDGAQVSPVPESMAGSKMAG